MPKFFIDVDDGDHSAIDAVGREFPDAAAGRLEALSRLPDMARDKIPDGDHRSFVVTLRDANRVVLYVATLALMGGWRNSVISAKED